MDSINVTRYRVYNKCKYDIGVVLSNGQQLNIRPDSFQLMTADDIAFVDSICANRKFFTQKMLVPCDSAGNAIPLDKLNMVEDLEAKQHLSDEVIEMNLKQNIKKLEAWLKQIEDPSELHAIYEVATKLDLPSSKLKLLASMMPDKDWLDQMNAE